MLCPYAAMLFIRKLVTQLPGYTIHARVVSNKCILYRENIARLNECNNLTVLQVITSDTISGR